MLGVTRWDGGGKMGIKYARWMEELERMGDGGWKRGMRVMGGLQTMGTRRIRIENEESE